MKKLVFAMMALIAMSFASCDTNVGTKNAPEQDSITTKMDSIDSASTTEDTAQVAAAPTDATAKDAAPADTAEPEEKK